MPALTPDERRGGLLVVLLLLIGTGWDVWRASRMPPPQRVVGHAAPAVQNATPESIPAARAVAPADSARASRPQPRRRPRVGHPSRHRSGTRRAHRRAPAPPRRVPVGGGAARGAKGGAEDAGEAAAEGARGSVRRTPGGGPEAEAQSGERSVPGARSVRASCANLTSFAACPPSLAPARGSATPGTTSPPWPSASGPPPSSAYTDSRCGLHRPAPVGVQIPVQPCVPASDTAGSPNLPPGRRERYARVPSRVWARAFEHYGFGQALRASSSIGPYVQEDIGQKLLEAKLIDDASLSRAAAAAEERGRLADRRISSRSARSPRTTCSLPVAHVQRAADRSQELRARSGADPLIPGDVAIKFMALPVSRSGRRLVVAMANPTNIFAIDDIKFITGYDVEPHVATESALKKAIDRAYDSAGTMADVMKGHGGGPRGRRGGGQRRSRDRRSRAPTRRRSSSS